MRINLQTLSHEPLVWKNTLPAKFKGVRLPGANLASAQGAFGSVCIQELHAKHFHIQYKVFDVLEQFTSSEKWQGDGWHTRLILRGHMLQSINACNESRIYKNQLTAISDPSLLVANTFEKKTCITFDTFFNKRIISETLNDYPSFFKVVSNQKPGNLLTAWSDVETFELVYSVLHSKYKKDVRAL
jgi:hypothetical protein